MSAEADGRVMSPSSAERLLLRIFRAFPPRHTIFADVEPRAAGEYEDEKRFGFERYFGRDVGLFRDRDVLDLGCGYGGRPIRFLEVGARSVTGIEVSGGLVAHAESFAAERGVTAARFLVGTGEAIPCAAGAFDLVTMNDVMEHVVDPQRVLDECFRVLRPGGCLAVVFPPYYDVTAGSHLHGYATAFPALNLVFPTRTLKSASRRVLEERGVDYRQVFREVPSDKLWNLNGLTSRRFRRLVRMSGFEIQQLWHLGHLDHRLSDHRGVGAVLRRPAFWSAEVMARLPLVQELFCVRIAALLSR